VEGFLRVVLGEVPPANEAVERTRAVSPAGADSVEALLAATFSPTIVSASVKRNVIPAVCELEVDCRLLPGQHPEHVEPMIRAVLGGDVDYELEWIEARGGTRSPLDTPLWQALEEFVAEAEPGARAAPLACAGFTDSHWLREAFGTVAYGFFPATGELPPDGRGLARPLRRRADPVSDLELGVGWLRHAARLYSASATTLRRGGQEEGEGPARGYGAPERRARARAPFMGVRDSHDDGRIEVASAKKRFRRRGSTARSCAAPSGSPRPWRCCRS
jgi:hypothetical protein